MSGRHTHTLTHMGLMSGRETDDGSVLQFIQVTSLPKFDA